MNDVGITPRNNASVQLAVEIEMQSIGNGYWNWSRSLHVRALKQLGGSHRLRLALNGQLPIRIEGASGEDQRAGGPCKESSM